MEGLIALAVLLVIVLIVLVNCIKIVPQAHAMVIERLGGYLTTWSVGLHLKVPFIDRIAKKVILKEQVVDFPPQPVITNNADRHCSIFPDYRSKALRIRSRESNHGN